MYSEVKPTHVQSALQPPKPLPKQEAAPKSPEQTMSKSFILKELGITPYSNIIIIFTYCLPL